jgi:hypothetical protein
LACLKYNIVSPTIFVLLVNINNFEPKPILVNINKLKPYRYLKQVFRGLEDTIEWGGEHKDDLENNKDL